MCIGKPQSQEVVRVSVPPCPQTSSDVPSMLMIPRDHWRQPSHKAQASNSNPSLPLASDPATPHLLSFNTLIHMITIKLSSSNYLLWKSQLFPLLISQDLLGHANGTFLPPPPYDPTHSHTSNDKHLAWNAAD